MALKEGVAMPAAAGTPWKIRREGGQEIHQEDEAVDVGSDASEAEERYDEMAEQMDEDYAAVCQGAMKELLAEFEVKDPELLAKEQKKLADRKRKARARKAKETDWCITFSHAHLDPTKRRKSYGEIREAQSDDESDLDIGPVAHRQRQKHTP
eukprot:12430398-Karenia_brevis.AAC.1